VRRRAPLNLLAAAAALVIAAVAPAAAPAHAAQVHAAQVHAAHRDTADGTPTVEVFAAGGGLVADGADLQLSVVVANPSTHLVTAGGVAVSVTSHPLATPAALTAFQQHPTAAQQRTLGAESTTSVPAGSTQVVAQLIIPAASVNLPSSSPGVFGLTARVTTSEGALAPGAGTLIVPGTSHATVGIAAVMAITAPTSTSGLLSAQDLTTYTAPDGPLTRELTIAQRNPQLTVGIDPKLLVSIRVLGQSAPASAQAWLTALARLANATFPLQYADADPVLQMQAGLAKPLQPTDFGYAMSPGNFGEPLTAGEPTGQTATPTPTMTPTPTGTPTENPQLPPLSQLVAFPYKLDGIAWPASGVARAADLGTLAAAGLTKTIVSGSNTNAASLSTTPNPALRVHAGTALVTDDALSKALQTAATASDATDEAVATSALNAQLALAATHAPSGGVVVASLGRIWPTDTARAANAVSTALGSAFSRASSLDAALRTSTTPGLTLVDRSYGTDRVQTAGALLDLAGEPRAGASAPSTTIATFSSVLVTPALLTGQVRARLLDLFAVGWAGSTEWGTAASKQLANMRQQLSDVQIVSPGSIRQASRQALIPLTVTNKLAHPVEVVLRATPSSARLEVDADTVKTIAAGSSAKILVPVKSQLSNGTVHLDLQLYSRSGVPIGASRTAEIDVHADWEGIGALVFGVVVVGFFGFGLFRTVQRRRREKAAPAAQDGEANA